LPEGEVTGWSKSRRKKCCGGGKKKKNCAVLSGLRTEGVNDVGNDVVHPAPRSCCQRSCSLHWGAYGPVKVLPADVSGRLYWLPADVAGRLCWLPEDVAGRLYLQPADLPGRQYWLPADVAGHLYWLPADVAGRLYLQPAGLPGRQYWLPADASARRRQIWTSNCRGGVIVYLWVMGYGAWVAVVRQCLHTTVGRHTLNKTVEYQCEKTVWFCAVLVSWPLRSTWVSLGRLGGGCMEEWRVHRQSATDYEG
jgi:hypothetical protein